MCSAGRHVCVCVHNRTRRIVFGSASFAAMPLCECVLVGECVCGALRRMFAGAGACSRGCSYNMFENTFSRNNRQIPGQRELARSLQYSTPQCLVVLFHEIMSVCILFVVLLTQGFCEIYAIVPSLERVLFFFCPGRRIFLHPHVCRCVVDPQCCGYAPNCVWS